MCVARPPSAAAFDFGLCCEALASERLATSVRRRHARRLLRLIPTDERRGIHSGLLQYRAQPLHRPLRFFGALPFRLELHRGVIFGVALLGRAQLFPAATEAQMDRRIARL